ncbi:MAG: cytochrome c family protein [marine benthic group bacterium]|nr:cytochrome c family protein [Candidatus Carthagonibacter metallireducens]MCL7985919.1 cytochrome c family protein [Gemmatimonadota bacterium]
MRGRRGFGFLLALSVALVSFGCEGDTGPQGPQGPEGPQGPPGDDGTVSEFAFQGDFGSACLHCHATITNNYVTTGHRFAFDDLGAENQSNLYCVQCHTTGFNCDVNADTGEIIDGSCVEPDDGYSGYIGDDSEEGLARKASLEGVQCESCHGAMGPDFNAHVPEISFSTWENSLCAGCHDAQIDEWQTSGHAQVAGGDVDAFNEEHYVGRTSCDYCHTSEGYIRENDPSYADYDFGDRFSHIGCPTCHDPHVGEDGGGNEAQLRTVGVVELSYTTPWEPGDEEAPVIEGYGPGQTCVQCHKARRDNDNVANQIANGYGHFGPHGSPQGDMFIGAGSYLIPDLDYGQDADGYVSHPHQGIPDGCVTCHMAFDEAFGGHIVHNFNPDIGVCADACHPGATDFDVNGVQTAIRGKLDQVAVLMGYADWDTLYLTLDADNFDWTVEQREAVYGAEFVYASGDLGVHNPNYANALLDNAIAYLTP